LIGDDTDVLKVSQIQDDSVNKVILM